MAAEKVSSNFSLQPAVSSSLLRIVESDRVGSAYLFSGPRGAGKEAVAAEFAALLNCENLTESGRCKTCPSCIRSTQFQHENIKFIVPLPTAVKDKTSKDPLKGLSPDELQYLTDALKEKSVNPFYKIRVPRATRILLISVQELRKKLYLKSLSKGRKIVLIYDAHLLSSGQGESANALLKILEEPPDNTTLILVTDHKSELLPTIISRCQQVDFPPIVSDIVVQNLISRGVDQRKAEFISGIAEGDMYRAISLSEQSKDEIISLMKSLVKAACTPDGPAWKKFVNDYSKTARYNPGDFNYHLYLLQLWFRSVARYQNDLEDPLHLDDLQRDVQKFNDRYPVADFAGIDEEIEKVFTAMDRNLFMPLVLTNMLINIQKELHGNYDVK